MRKECAQPSYGKVTRESTVNKDKVCCADLSCSFFLMGVLCDLESPFPSTEKETPYRWRVPCECKFLLQKGHLYSVSRASLRLVTT